MGFNPFKPFKKAVKSVVKGVSKIVKGVVKGVKKVAKSVVKGVKGITKSFSKMGPLASIAMGFMTGGMTLFSNPLWNAMAKGALTGFVGSGGQLKGALMGGLTGGVMQVGAGAIEGWKMAEGGLTDKISGAFQGGAKTLEEGFGSLYKASDSFINGGGDLTNAQAGHEIASKVHAENISIEKDYYFENSKYSAGQQAEIVEYAKNTNTNLEQAEMLWQQTGGSEVDMSFDYKQTATDTYEKTNMGLKATREAAFPDLSPEYLGTEGWEDLDTTTTKKLSMPKKQQEAPTGSLLDYPQPYQSEFEDPNKPPVTSAGTGFRGSMSIQQAYAALASGDPTQVSQAQQVIARHQQSQQLQYSYG